MFSVVSLVNMKHTMMGLATNSAGQMPITASTHLPSTQAAETNGLSPLESVCYLFASSIQSTQLDLTVEPFAGNTTLESLDLSTDCTGAMVVTRLSFDSSHAGSCEPDPLAALW